MSIKIYNGYKLKEDLSLRALEDKTTQLKRLIQSQADQLFKHHSINEIYYMYDLYKMFPEKFYERYKKITGYEYRQEPKVDKSIFILDVVMGVKRMVKSARQSEALPFYNLEACIHIIPIKNKTLILWYGESDQLRTIFECQDWIEGYHYQNQADRPEDLSEEEWELRRLDWEEALPNGVPSDRGFTVDLVDEEKFPFLPMNVFEGMRVPTVEERAYSITIHNYKPEKVDQENNKDVEIKLYEEKIKEIAGKLDKDSFLKYVST
jgi:hypothetical protein